MQYKDSVSFNVDHENMDTGIYLSRTDVVGNEKVVTIDLRLRAPYKHVVLTPEEMHSFEHTFSTAVREVFNKEGKVTPIYVGPMGCATGFYIVLGTGETDNQPFISQETITYLLDNLYIAVERARAMKHIPANERKRCGNIWTLHEGAAKQVAREAKEIIWEAMYMNKFHEYKYLEE